VEQFGGVCVLAGDTEKDVEGGDAGGRDAVAT
jgi:hypothetical protein